MSIENPQINDAQFADALLNQSLQGCKKPEEDVVKPIGTGCRVNLDAVTLEQQNFG